MAKGIDPTLMAELIALGDRVTEDRLYEIAIEEIERNQFDGVAKALALEEAEGDEKKSRAFYTKHRVRRIRDALTQQAVVVAQEELEAKEKVRAEKLEAKKQKKKPDLAVGEPDKRFDGVIASVIILFALLVLGPLVFAILSK